MREPTAAYTVSRWPKIRNGIEYFLRAQKPYTVFGYGEFDVTALLKSLQLLRTRHRVALSLNTFLIYAFARAAVKHEKARTFKSRNRLIVFEHVNLSVPILKTMPSGIKVPVMYVVRNAGAKSLVELHREMRHAVRSDLADDPDVRFRRKLFALPAFVQSLVYRYVFSSPIRTNRYFGNVGLTNLQPAGHDSTFIGFPPNIYTCQFSVGNITERFLPDADKRPALRKILTVGAGIDHILMDGMGIAALAKDIAGLIEQPEAAIEFFIHESTVRQETGAHGNS